MNHPRESNPRQAVLEALKQASRDRPMDAYQAARAARTTPMQAGRTLLKLRDEGVAATDDPLDTVNDLAARFYPCASAV